MPYSLVWTRCGPRKEIANAYAASSGRRRRHRQHGIERFGVAGIAQFAGDIGIAQETRDARQRLEMVGAGGFRREQQKNEIYRLTVERLELHGPFESRKQSEQLVELRQLAVRNGEAGTDASRTELLALLKNLENRALALAAELGGLGGQLLQNLLLAVDLQRRNDGIGRDEIGEQHGPFSGDSGGSAWPASQRRRTISTRRGHVNRRCFRLSVDRYSRCDHLRGGTPDWRGRVQRDGRDITTGFHVIASRSSRAAGNDRADASMATRSRASRPSARPSALTILAPTLVTAQPRFDAYGCLIGACIGIGRERFGFEHDARVEMDHALGAETEPL